MLLRAILPQRLVICCQVLLGGSEEHDLEGVRGETKAGHDEGNCALEFELSSILDRDGKVARSEVE